MGDEFDPDHDIGCADLSEPNFRNFGKGAPFALKSPESTAFWLQCARIWSKTILLRPPDN
jgi:hypothetical protein